LPRASVTYLDDDEQCRQQKLSWTIEEVCGAANVTKWECGKFLKAIKALKIYHRPKTAGGKSGKKRRRDDEEPEVVSSAEPLMVRFCSRLGLSTKTTEMCRKLAMHIAHLSITEMQGKKPASVATAIIYLVGRLTSEADQVVSYDDASTLANTRVESRVTDLVTALRRQRDSLDGVYAAQQLRDLADWPLAKGLQPLPAAVKSEATSESVKRVKLER
jgi:transcription initiation factor TFIIIB Brf1 subunit/transcription initiation factor TFIIB